MNSIAPTPAPHPEAERPDPLQSLAALVPEPRSIDETGLTLHVLAELTARTMYYRGEATEAQLSDWLGLGRAVIDELTEAMKRDGLLEALSHAGPLQYRYALTGRGRERALESSKRDGYVGPAPVPYQQYVDLQAAQSVRALDISPDDVRDALAHLVQPAAVVAAIGAGVISAGSVLLFGESGNGKSTVAAAVRDMLTAPMAVPHALELGGRTMRVLDARVHEPYPGADSAHIDGRFALVRRPMVTLGTELTLSDLEIGYAEADGTFMAPPQVKASGGVLVVDDLGRQAVPPAELLNRWMAPMATGVDQLNLRGGEMLRVPFDVLLVFATNLSPGDLGDEAFLRRIRHKVAVPDPSRAEYLEIFRRDAARLDIPFALEPVEVILREYYEADDRPLRCSHPGDLLQNLIDFANLERVTPELSNAALRRACDAYFVR